jgi:hypothetical protein
VRKGMGSPIVRTIVASDRYSMPPGLLGEQLETCLKMLRELRPYATDAGIKIAIERQASTLIRKLDGYFEAGISVSPNGQDVLLHLYDSHGSDLMLVEDFR